MSILAVENVSKSFGGLTAASNVNFEVGAGAIVSLIGPNGAGKTTLFNIITGIYQPAGGRVLFKGESLTGLKPHSIARMGIARTFQNLRLFQDLTALENAMIGGFGRSEAGLMKGLLDWRRESAMERENRDRAWKSLEFVGMEERADELARNLPYGDQRRLEIARALSSEPDLLLLDEPTAGMNPRETRDLMELCRGIHERGVSILLIEHDMSVVMGISDRIVVLDYGRKIAEGAPEEIQNDRKVIDAYLGVGNGAV